MIKAGSELNSLEDVRSALMPVRDRLLQHPIYDFVNTIPRLRVFMEHHVFAVWDFMCIAKRLQRDLTCMEELWRPPQYPSLARFVNGMIYAEESDIDPDGQPASHFELYLTAMNEVGASAKRAEEFIERLKDSNDLEASLKACRCPDGVRRFVGNTISTCRNGKTIEVLASFLFGREDLIPEMFARFLPQWGDSFNTRRFAYYVQRHIDLDGSDHGPAAMRALSEIAGDDAENWLLAAAAAEAAIDARIALWDSVYVSLGGC